jgi:AraC family transcriptional regulator
MMTVFQFEKMSETGGARCFKFRKSETVLNSESDMLILEKGAYLGKVLDLSEADGILAGATSYFPGDGTGVMHYHENSHLSFVLRGGGIEKRKSSEYERLAGQIMFFHAGEPHQCINKLFPARNVNLEIDSVFLSDNQVTESNISASVLKNPNAKFIMLKVYKELLAADDFSRASIKLLLLNLICGVREEAKGEPPWVGIIRELMNDRWNEPLSLKDLSRAAGVHPVTISRFFPRYFSCTFGEYMRRLKIEKSLPMIKCAPRSLTEIAYECGFYDQSHFTRTFKNLTGFLPNSYAKL